MIAEAKWLGEGYGLQMITSDWFGAKRKVRYIVMMVKGKERGVSFV